MEMCTIITPVPMSIRRPLQSPNPFFRSGVSTLLMAQSDKYLGHHTQHESTLLESPSNTHIHSLSRVRLLHFQVSEQAEASLLSSNSPLVLKGLFWGTDGQA